MGAVHAVGKDERLREVGEEAQQLECGVTQRGGACDDRGEGRRGGLGVDAAARVAWEVDAQRVVRVCEEEEEEEKGEKVKGRRHC